MQASIRNTLFGLALAVAAGHASANEPIKIGSVLPVTGPAASIITPMMLLALTRRLLREIQISLA